MWDSSIENMIRLKFHLWFTLFLELRWCVFTSLCFYGRTGRIKAWSGCSAPSWRETRQLFRCKLSAPKKSKLYYIIWTFWILPMESIFIKYTEKNPKILVETRVLYMYLAKQNIPFEKPRKTSIVQSFGLTPSDLPWSQPSSFNSFFLVLLAFLFFWPAESGVDAAWTSP